MPRGCTQRMYRSPISAKQWATQFRCICRATPGSNPMQRQTSLLQRMFTASRSIHPSWLHPPHPRSIACSSALHGGFHWGDATLHRLCIVSIFLWRAAPFLHQLLRGNGGASLLPSPQSTHHLRHDNQDVLQLNAGRCIQLRLLWHRLQLFAYMTKWPEHFCVIEVQKDEASICSINMSRWSTVKFWLKRFVKLTV